MAQPAASPARKNALWVFLLLVLVLAFFWRLTAFPGNLIYSPDSDITRIFLHTRAFPRESLSQYRQIPLWNPFVLSGTPFLGNPQSAMFYPPHLLFLILPAEPLMGWMIAAHLGLAAIGMFFLLRNYGIKGLAAATGSVIFAFSQIMTSRIWAGHYATILGVAWIPWVILAYEKMKHSWRHFLTLGASLTLMYLTGHTQEFFYTSFVIGCFTVVDAVILLRKSGLSAAMRHIALATFSLLMCLGLAAVDVLPSIEAARWSLRSGGLSLREAADASIHPFQLILTLLNPLAFGPAELGVYFGPWNYWEMSAYVGILPLALLGLAFVRSIPRPHVLRYGVLAGLALLFSLGKFTPLFALLYHSVPGFGWFRIPSRGMFFFSVALAFLAAVAAERLLSPDRTDRKVFAGIGLSILLILVGGLLLTRPLQAKLSDPTVGKENLARSLSQEETFAYALRRTFTGKTFAVVALAVSGFLFLHARGWMPRFSLGPILLALVLGDLWAYGLPLVKTEPLEKALPETEAVRFLTRAGPPADRVWDVTSWVMDREAMRHRIRTIGGYEPTARRYYADYIEAMLGLTEKIDLHLFRTWNVRKTTMENALSDNLVDFLNVGYIVTSEEVNKPNWEEVKRTLVEEDGHFYSLHIYRNRSVLPQEYVVHRARRLIADRPISEQLREIQPQEEVLLPSDEGIFSSYPEPDEEEPVVMEEFTPNRMRLSVRMRRPGYLVTSEVWMPGWRAKVDGAESRVLRGNLAFRAIPLDAGEHEVEMFYWPAAFTRGIVITSIALAAAFALGLLFLLEKLKRLQAKGD